MQNDLISRSDAIKRAKAAEIEMGSINGIKAVPMGAVIQFLEIVPAVDTVEVVRCRDCKYRKTERCQMYWESEDGREQYNWETDDDFCSSGKRRDECV